MSDRQLRSKIGQYSTAEETSEEEATPEITGQTLAQHSEKGVSQSDDHRSNESSMV